MRMVGFLLVFAGALFVVVSTVFFYSYGQDVLASGTSGSTPTVTEALRVYNGTAAMPIFVGLSIFGATFLVMGTVFFVGGQQLEISEGLMPQTVNPLPQPTENYPARPVPAKACIKCGSLLYQNTAYCPNCGSPLSQAHSNPTPAAQS